MFRIAVLFLFFLVSNAISAQFKVVERTGAAATYLKKPEKPITTFKANAEPATSFPTLGRLSPGKIQSPIRAVAYDKNKMPIHIKGWLNDAVPSSDRQLDDYLHELGKLYQVTEPSKEWKVEQLKVDGIGMLHYKVQQVFEEVPVYAGELTLHLKNEKITHAMGRGFPSPELPTTVPSLSIGEAKRRLLDILNKKDGFVEIPVQQLEMLKMQQIEMELVIYHEELDARKERLAYHIKAYENLGSFVTYFMDAHTGEILHEHQNICKFHSHTAPPDGPTTTNAVDLGGINRTLNVYEVNGIFYFIDASRPNFKFSQSTLPDDPQGVIWTLDANNSSPAADDFEIFHIANNDNITWSDRSAVSAHYNASVAYEYFRNVHGRNAIDGGGGNVISFVNVTDEDGLDMDNAFWNGVAMFYGNGNEAFTPLAGGLDVAGHEMTHGVIQASANLEYMGESGALNESFADIFAVMMDREDYQIGEDVVTSVFPSGALRDLSDPNNGGNRLGDIGWQPNNVSEQFLEPRENEDVHINSGIPNHAFYLFAEQVGKEKAEKVYYRALTEYLTRSSRFVDARIAVVQSALDLYGNSEAEAAKQAFSQVGIGEGSGGDYTSDAMVNDGSEFLIYTDLDRSKYVLLNAALESILDPASEFAPISVPSVTDDGSLIFYVNANNQIAFTSINWDTGDVGSDLFTDQQIWSNVVVSKDGNRIAAVEAAQSNRIQVFDFSKGEWYTDAFGEFGFELYNPTFTQGVSTGDAKFADAMEFDISGEILMYDVYSEIQGSFGESIGYWDIGFLNVWENSSATWGDGFISKMFSNLAEGLSVGNPTFSKNSPYIIAFDYIEGNVYSVLAANVETGDIGLIFENSSLGYPSYGGSDEQMVFTNSSTTATDLFLINLRDEKIFPEQNTVGKIVDDAQWGVVFRNGSRILSDVEDITVENEPIIIYPNPVADQLTYEIDIKSAGQYELLILSSDGKVVRQKAMNLQQGSYAESINLSNLPSGQYVLKLQHEKFSSITAFNKR